MTKKSEKMNIKSDAELGALLKETRASLRTERFAAAGARPKDPNILSKSRKVIARILTEQSARSKHMPQVSAS